MEANLVSRWLQDEVWDNKVLVFPWSAEAFVGQWHPAFPYVLEPVNPGMFRITYGCRAATRTLVCDLRTYRLYLGQCEQVRVEAKRWRGPTVTGTVNQTMRIAADISPSIGAGAYDEPTATMIHFYGLGTSPNGRALIPAAARWASPLVSTMSVSTTYWGSANPDILFSAAVPVVVSPANNRWLPGFTRLEVSGGSDRFGLVDWACHAPLVDSLDIGVRFYLGT